MMTHQTRVYLYGAVAASMNGFANSMVVVMVDPTTFNLFQGGWKKLFAVAVASAMFSFFTYLKDHPLPMPQDADFAAAAQAKISAIVKSGTTGTGTGDGTSSLPNLKLE